MRAPILGISRLRNFAQQNFAGFTMMELLTVVVVIGMLAALGIPNYRRRVVNEYRQRALDNLFLIYTAEQAYRQANGGYIADQGRGASAAPDDPVWEALKIESPYIPGVPVEYRVSVRGQSTQFTAVAFWNPAGTGGCQLGIDETRTILDDWPLGCGAM